MQLQKAFEKEDIDLRNYDEMAIKEHGKKNHSFNSIHYIQKTEILPIYVGLMV